MSTLTIDEYFSGHPVSRALFDLVAGMIGEIGPAEVRASKSQVAFRRATGLAWAWIPGLYLPRADVPLVLSVCLRRRDESPRWKQVVEPVPGRFMHHLELRSPADVDGEVAAWLAEAWSEAGASRRRTGRGPSATREPAR